MGGAMLCKSLIQFSVDGWGCVPSLLYVLRSNWGRGDEDNGFLQRSYAHTATRSAPNLLSTHTSTGDSWTRTGKSGSVSCGVTAPFSWVLVHKVVCSAKSLFPQSCVSAGGSRVGLMVTSSKRAYAIPTSTTPRAPDPAEVHCWHILPQETLKHSLSQSQWGLCVLVCTRYVWPHWVSLARMEFDSKHNFVPSAILLGLHLCPLKVG